MPEEPAKSINLDEPVTIKTSVQTPNEPPTSTKMKQRVQQILTPPITRLAAARDEALRSPVHDERTAAILGICLGVAFTTCFVTGLISHVIQHPQSWFTWPSRPAGFYRITQGLHIATGIAAIALLLAKLWSVSPKLVQWPPVRGVAHAIERVMLVPLVFGSLFMLATGTANVARWYPWGFFFPTGHYWVSWIVIGALVAHIGAKISIASRALKRITPEGTHVVTATPKNTIGRRGFIALAAATSGFMTLTTAGQTFAPFKKLTLFAPRRPDIGSQGLPINRVADDAIRAAASSEDFRFRIMGRVEREVELTVDDLRRQPQNSATLPIACVEGWSASADWRGVRISDLLDAAGAPTDHPFEVEVRSVERGGLYGTSTLNHIEARDVDTLLALELNGETLSLDHGYPCRLIGPNRSGVLQTKWVTELVVR